MTVDSVWDRVADGLTAHGVDTVFGLPGDDMAILGALERSGIRVVLVRDQRHALYQAIGYGRISGRPSVCFVGKGPALTHAATGLLEARSLRQPLVLLSSGVPEERLGTGAFQELDPLETLGALTVGAIRVDQDTVTTGIAEAFRLSRGRGRGPVIVEVPEGLASAPPTRARAGEHERARADIAVPSVVRHARRPIVLAGGGCAGVGDRVLALVDRLGAAVSVTASGRGVIDETHPAFVGVSGLYAPAGAAAIMRGVDVIVALGSRLEETATFGWDAALAPGCRIVQVLDDEAEFTSTWAAERIVADVADVVHAWTLALPVAPDDDDGWSATVAAAHAGLLTGDGAAPVTTPGAIPRVRDVLRDVDAAVPTARISIHENGLQDMWSYVFPHWIVRRGAACLVPSEQTPLGFGMGAARGVAAADPRPVVVIGGDGAFCAVGPDLAGFAEIESPMLVVVLTNGGFGWLEANRRRVGAPFSFIGSRTVVRGLCAAYGLAYEGCDDAAELGDAVRRAWRHAETGRAVVLDVAVALDDVPPGFEELAGDFPQVRPPGVAGEER